MSTVVGEIAVIGSSIETGQSGRMRRKPNCGFVVRDYTPVTPDGAVMGRSGDHVTLLAAAVRLRLECRADRVELWRERALEDSIRRGDGLVV